MLSKLGYTAEFYASGDAVLAKLEGRVVDVVLLDLKMPVCDGFECARRYLLIIIIMNNNITIDSVINLK